VVCLLTAFGALVLAALSVALLRWHGAIAEFVERNNNILTAISTLVVAVFTVILAVATIYLWSAGERQIGFIAEAVKAANASNELTQRIFTTDQRAMDFSTRA
jgi:hypothetical protein